MREWGLTVLRVVVGVVFMVQGWTKLMLGFQTVAQTFAKLGIPGPLPVAIAVTVAELLCGLALILGLRARWMTVLLACIIVFAMWTSRLGGGFFVPTGYELVVTLLAALIALGLAGPGALAIDNTRRRAKS